MSEANIVVAVDKVKQMRTRQKQSIEIRILVFKKIRHETGGAAGAMSLPSQVSSFSASSQSQALE